MKPFSHINAKTLDEAVSALHSGKSSLIAGGTDLLGTLKDNILPEYPATVVNLKSVPGLDYIREEGGTLKIGALARLADIAENPAVTEKYTALAQAAKAVATPHLRDMGTIGGTISQLPRCWYFRKPDNRFPCLRKGGSECFAILGDNRYHSAFGGAKICDTPCTRECPNSTDIPGYFAKLREGDWDAAAQIFLKRHPLPMITGRICAHPCQKGCNRNQTDKSVATNCVERTLGDYILENADKYYAPPAAETGKSVAIVGSGPAGLSAAYFMRKAGNKVTVFDVKPEAGGMLMYAIPAYRLPKDLVRRVIDIYKKMGVEFRLGIKVGTDVMPEELERSYDSVLYATGTWKRPVMGLSGEELTVFGLDFLVEIKEWMNGKLGQEVFVMGGGNVAMDVAMSAKRLGAKKVTLACLESREKMPASPEEIERAEAEGIIIMPGWGLSKVVEENGVVKGMEIKRCLNTIDASGNFNPQYDENDKKIIEAENIMLATGQRVDLSYFGEKYEIQLNRRGFLDIDAATGMTSRKGIFGAGDAVRPGLAIAAIAAGRRAAAGMNTYLGVPNTAVTAAPGPLTFDAEGVTATEPLVLRELSVEKRRIDLEDSTSATREEALAETRRCMNCGCHAIHPSDVAPALIALNARIVTSRRTVDAEDFFAVKVASNTVLDADEIITEIQVPAPAAGSKSAYMKFAFRKSIDFPVVGCAVVTGSSPRIALGAVATSPIRAAKAEKLIAGKVIDETLAEAAGAAAVEDARPLRATKYKVQIAKTLVKRTLLSLK
ncbi:NADPH-dependent glutamate synthase beta chain [Sporobacter termitidis DSM 10068]|uniref:NADPH-dependent glutamate synthase beta chain n=1 Tax=Sporobacter termitidis DSM 10068 TaxID=1123282 RepID=A0A1M5YXU9_9FIRM|nr:FAD binding domain-containing protein [Sporobacter termitidis]SHI16805.1 NADPH-dependent glutamate synthase beta chain [Sporobacter termitidis DSM 10068]